MFAAAVNARNAQRETPLHQAAMGGDEGIVTMLIDGGADMDAKRANDETA